MRFTKMHGCGNDFICIDEFASPVINKAAFARFMCDRRKGIGGDGVAFIGRSETADCLMDIYNSDGSQAMMCGNAIRCVAALTGASTVETLSGVKKVSVNPDRTVTVDMGAAVFSENPLPQYPLNIVDMGNPHAVILVDDVQNAPVRTLGAEISQAYEGGINVEFVKVISESALEMRVWERGAGETMACGTGACASAAAAHKLGLTKNTVSVTLPGGILQIEIAGTIFMTGEAVKVFEGEIAWQQ